MITEIGYADGQYFIWADGHCVSAASTQHEADMLLSTIQEADASWAMGGLSNIRQPILRCGLPNPLYRVQHSDPPVDIPDEYPDPTPGGPEPPEWNRPLLAQCAEVIRACLGGPVATSGIVDELRRVERALAEVGW